MTVISKIQKHSYILVGLIALALISFLFMDISGNANLISQGMNYVGKVNGEKLGYEAFDDEYKKMETSYVQMKGGQALTDVEQQTLKNQGNGMMLLNDLNEYLLKQRQLSTEEKKKIYKKKAWFFLRTIIIKNRFIIEY
jgi:hypothetical protein